MVSTEEKSGEDENFFNDTGEANGHGKTNMDMNSRGTDDFANPTNLKPTLSYASAAIKASLYLLSLDFTIMRKDFKVSPSYLGQFCMDQLGLKKEEVLGIHRYGMNHVTGVGFIKIKTKNWVDVSKRYAGINGEAKNSDLHVKIRGFKPDDGMEIIRIISPNENLSLVAIENGINKICDQKSKIYEETFAMNVPLFGGLSNGNYRMRVKLKKEVNMEDDLNLKVDNMNVKIARVGAKKRCFKCKSSEHFIKNCPMNSETNSTPTSEIKTNEVTTPNEPVIEINEDMLPNELMGITEPETAVVEESPPSDDFYSPTEFEKSFPKLNSSQVKRKISSPKCTSQAKKTTSNLFIMNSNQPDIDRAISAPK